MVLANKYGVVKQMDITDNRPLIVIVDDEREILAALKRTLMRVDVHIESFTSPRLALEFMQKNQPVLVISDQRMPDITGDMLLLEIKKRWPKTKRIMLSAYEDFDSVSAGFNRAIIEKFISKPWKNSELIMLVQDSIASKISSPVKHQLHQSIIGESDQIKQLIDQISRAAGANVPIYIHGETGTGKELVAKACHQSGCKRAGKFIAVNCANFSETLIESQLYGHKKGAFTGAVSDQEGLFAQSNGGTIFLDEITTLPLSLQAKLLRVIQEREFTALGDNKLMKFDAQIIAASSVKLSDAVNNGEFREDLFYRLNVIPLNLPPLREREQDGYIIAQHFLIKYNLQQQKDFIGFSSDARDFIIAYSWPGNVRQLENTIHSICIMNSGKKITLAMIQPLLAEQLKIETPSIEVPNYSAQQLLANKTLLPTNNSDIIPLELVEKNAIEQAITKCEGNITKAAALLEVNPSTIYRKMQKWT